MFIHCPICGNAYSSADYSPEKIHCSKCDFDFYLSPKPCNALLIENDAGEILLVKRKFDPGKGKWDVPGGFMDPGETLEQSAEREAMEELGVHIGGLEYAGSYPDKYLFQGITSSVLNLMIKARITGGNLSAADDAEEIQFFSDTEIPWDELAFDYLHQALKDYLRLRQQK
jgi:ADP-ribose pyrophosphatase YjhB (NUDIX family)